MIGSDLLRYQKAKPYMVGDKETEGVNLFFSRPWEVAYLIADSHGVKQSFTRYIWWPDLNISQGAAIVTNFHYAEYKEKAEPADKVLKEYEEILFDPSIDIIGHNFYFDAYMHASWRRALGMNPDYSWMSRMYDTHCLFKAYKKGWTPDRQNYQSWQYKVQNWVENGLKSNLGFVCREFQIDYDSKLAHRALYDVEKTREVWEQIKWKIEV